MLSKLTSGRRAGARLGSGQLVAGLDVQWPVAVHDAYVARGAQLCPRATVALVFLQRRVRHTQLTIGTGDRATGTPLLLMGREYKLSHKYCIVRYTPLQTVW